MTGEVQRDTQTIKEEHPETAMETSSGPQMPPPGMPGGQGEGAFPSEGHTMEEEVVITEQTEQELAAEIDDIIQNLADSDKGCMLDRDEGIRDPLLPTLDIYNAIHVIHANATCQMDLIGLYDSGIVKAVVPPVYHTPELVRWCAENYDPVSRTVKNKITKQTILNITPEALQIMVMNPTTEEMRPLRIDELPGMYSSLSPSAKKSF